MLNVDPIAWLEQRFTIPDGQHAGDPLRIADVPWFRGPYLAGCDDATPFVNIYKATGAGGTTIGEAILAYNLQHRPIGAKYLYNIHLDDDSRLDIAAQRLWRQIDHIPEINLRYSQRTNDRNRARDRRFAIPEGHQLLVQGANESNAQQVRGAFLLNDELWAWKHGLYAQMKQRTTGDFPFFKIINVGSAARDETAEAAIEFREGCRAEFHLSCSHCDGLFIPLPGAESMKLYSDHVIQWDKDGSIGHKCSTVHLVCPHCDKEIPNKPSIRRHKLLDGADYIPQNPDSPHHFDPVTGEKKYRNYSCRFNSWIAWFTDWGDILERFLKAQAAIDYGDYAAITDFVIKDLAKTYRGQGARDSRCHVTDDYELIQRKIPAFPKKIWTAPEDDWGPEATRYMIADYQRLGHFWVWISQVDDDGNIRLLWAGRVEGNRDEKSGQILHDWQTLELVRSSFNVAPSRTAIDAATDAREADIYALTAARGYLCLRGDHREQTIDLPVDMPDGSISKRTVKSPIGPPISCGWYYDEEENEVEAVRLHWNTNWINNFADGIITGANKRIMLHLPQNLHKLEANLAGQRWRDSEKITTQLVAMVYGDPRKTKSKSVETLKEGKKEWHKRSAKAQEHFRDCFCMQLAMMFLDNYYDEVVQSVNE